MFVIGQVCTVNPSETPESKILTLITAGRYKDDVKLMVFCYSDGHIVIQRLRQVINNGEVNEILPTLSSTTETGED